MPPDKLNEDVYERFVRPCETRLIAAAWRIMRCHADADDVLQDAIVKIWKARESLAQHTCREAWMLRVVINTAFEHLRQRKPSPSTNLNGPDIASAPASIRGVDADLSHDETRNRILQALTSLSPQQAEAVLLRVVEDLPYDEVASALNCTVSTARVHVKRGRAKLRDHLKDLDPNHEGAVK